MGKFEIAAAREALLAAKDELLEGRVPGPLTGTRLAEVAGVLRHRLTIDNPDINAEFQARAKELNRTKPEVDWRVALGGIASPLRWYSVSG